jgi:hypothetical protein
MTDPNELPVLISRSQERIFAFGYHSCIQSMDATAISQDTTYLTLERSPYSNA